MHDDEVLVAIISNRLDLVLAREQHWYRVPMQQAETRLKKRWPPRWLAFYQPKVFGNEAFAVTYYCQVQAIRPVVRWQLFPDQPRDERSQNQYYQLILGPLQCLPKPVISRRWRRIVFITTTWQRLVNADEINDLFDDSPLEDRLWGELKRLHISAERQEFVRIGAKEYSLDFALYCVKGSLNVETDGDTWHGTRERIGLDNERDNALETQGWSLLRFNTRQINEQMTDYCLSVITEKINQLGGIDEGRWVARRASLDPDGPQQLSLLDDLDD